MLLLSRARVLLFILFVVSTQAFSQYSAWQKRLDGEGEAVAFNPLNPNTIFAQGNDNMLRISRNQGLTWTVLAGNVPYQVREIICHPNDTLTLFVTSFGNTLERSTNNGASWTTVLTDFGIDGESVTYDPMHPDTMYAGNFADGSLFRSTDRGANWTLRGAIGTNLCALAVRPDSANILLAGSGQGRISKSTNGGISWHLVKSAGSTEIPKIVIDPFNPQTAYATAFEGSVSATGVWKTTDGGENWALTSLQSIDVWCLDIDRTNPNILYAGTFDDYFAGIYVSTDAGATWGFSSYGFQPYNSMWNLKINPLDGSTVFVAVTDNSFGFNGIYKLGQADAGVTGYVRDSLTAGIISQGTLLNSPSGPSFNLANTSGAYSFYRFTGDTASNHTFSVYLSGYLFKQQPVTLVASSILTQDILVRLGSIQGTVFNDVNHNGVKDGGEAGLPGWTILKDANPAAVSDANGNYFIGSLFPGTYSITEQAQNGWTQTLPPSNYSISITGVNRDITAKDFGNHLRHRAIAVTPAPFSAGNSVLTTIQATFDTAMNVSSFNDTASFIVSGSRSGRHLGVFNFSGGNTIATLTPNVPFQAGEVVVVDITKKVQSVDGDSITPYNFQFSTASQAGPGVFPGPINYAAGDQPYDIVVGDIDNDQDNDIVVANRHGNTISVLKNFGNGVFAPSVDYPTRPQPQSIALVDVDNDGYLDVVTANTNSYYISVFKNDGAGQFPARVDYLAPGPPNGVAAADLNGDGYADILETDVATNGVTSFVNNGAGTFPSKVTHAGGGGPTAVIACDVNGDGAPDVLTTNTISQTQLEVLANLGSGVLSYQATYPAGTNAHTLLAADLNSDNLPDVVLSNSGLNSISVYPHTGSVYGSPVDYPVGTNPTGLASGDLDGDGLTDIVVTNQNSDSISIMRNTGGGILSRTDIPVPGGPHAVAIADLDGDGDMDLAVASSATDNVTVLLNGYLTTLAYSDGWNLVSVPVHPQSYNKQALYPMATSTAFAYEGNYVPTETLKYGYGYWVKFSGSGPLLFRGDSVNADTIPVGIKWNMVGSLTAPFPVGSVTSNPNGIISSNFFGYDGSYSIADTIKPGKAYWVKTSQAGELMMNSGAIQLPSRAIPAEKNLKALNSLKFADASRSQTLYFGSAEKAGITNLARFELPPASPDGKFDARFASNRIIEQEPSNGAAHFPVIYHGSGAVTVSWDIVDESRYHWQLQSGSQVREIGGKGGMTVSGDQGGSLSIKGIPAGESIPKEFAVDQNYPNPFNPATVINYQLPYKSRVTIGVYNMLGEEVRVLVNGNQDEGYKTVTWDASNSPSGIYFYRLQAIPLDRPSDAFVQTRRMILLK